MVFISGNDKQHTETGRTTTKGTPQDTHGQWYEHYQAAKEVDIKSIEILASVADVHYVHCMSNHDYRNGYMLADSIMSWFNRNSNVTFDVGHKYYKYLHYGVSLIGMTHGDGVKENELPDLMKTQCRSAWSKARFGYWYCHHIHHKDKGAYKGKKKIMMEKDYRDITVIGNQPIKQDDYVHVEYLRTPSGSDDWHQRKGYIHSKMAMEAFIHSREHGQTDRITEIY